jgi:hypothetical protein
MVRSNAVLFRLVPGLAVGLAFALAGCGDTALPDPSAMDNTPKPGNSGVSSTGGSAGGGQNQGGGGQSGFGGSAGSAGFAGSDNGPGGSGGDPGLGIPGGMGGQAGNPGADKPTGAAGCSMTDDQKQICVTCTDATGSVVRNGCYPKNPMTMPIDCYQLRRSDGTLCNLCLDDTGMVVKSSCADPPPPTPPPTTVSCQDENDGKQDCKVCYDQYMKETMRSCSPLPPAPPDGGTGSDQCTGQAIMGQMCIVCSDASGTNIKTDCYGAPTPTPPPTVKCADQTGMDGSACVVCYDESGQIIKQACTMPPSKS